jgi:hypothetical protein
MKASGQSWTPAYLHPEIELLFLLNRRLGWALGEKENFWLLQGFKS